MIFDVDVALTYQLGAARTALLALEAASIDGQSIIEQQLDIDEAEVSVLEGEWRIGQRSWVRSGSNVMRLRYRARVGVTREMSCVSELSAAPMDRLGAEQVTFLRPSRFCQSDQFGTFVANRFGGLAGGQRIQAILDWMAEEMSYDAAHSRGDTTLLETFAARRGVCRDYAHMLCGLARASHVPARYVSAYGLSVDPPDFHAVVQLWLDNDWHLIDPSGMCKPDEIIVIGVGRDAADVPFMETPDEARFIAQSVHVARA